MQNKWKYIVVVVLCTGCFIAGITAERCSSVPIETIRIVEKEKPVIKYIKVPSTCEEYMACYKEPIVIDGKMVDAVWFLATATDTCKSTERKFRLDVSVKRNPNLVQLQYVHFFTFRNGFGMDIGGNLSYYRTLLDFGKFQFGIGGGLTVTNHSAGLNLGTSFQF
jgi:hypothetical protein